MGNLILSCFLLFALTPKAFAADKGSQFGVLWGLSVPDADNTNPFHLFGVKGETFLSPIVSFGGYYMVSDKAGENSTIDKFRYSLTGISAAYHIPAANGDTFIAFRMGVTKLRESPQAIDVTYSPYHYGFATGYDYYLNTWLSVGFEGSYLHVLPGRTFSSGIEYDQQSFNIISFLITLNIRL